MYILSEISEKLKKILNLKDSKKYLQELIDSLEQKIETDENLPFKIKGLRKGGFLVKTNGLYAFIPFRYMPWDYHYQHFWELIYPTIKEKIFFGRVLRFKKDPIGIILHAKVPQFKKPDLIENESYKGILINKSKFGLFIDIGYHFSWNCGSLVGLLHESNCKDYEKQRRINPGQEIRVYFLGFNDNNKMIFADNLELKEWYTGEINNLIGQKANVKVLKNKKGRLNFKVNDKYKGKLPVTKLIYPGIKKTVKRKLENLNNNDIIICEIIDVNIEKKTLTLKTDLSSLPKKTKAMKTKNNIANNMDKGTFERLQNIKNEL